MSMDLWLAVGFAFLGLSVILLGAFKKAKNESARMYVNNHDSMPEFQHFRQKTAEEPNNPVIWLQWGHALIRSANRGTSHNLKLLRYNEACTCYKQATEINHHFVEAWASWGAALYELFRLHKASDVFMMEGGHNKFQAAVDLRPDSPKLWALWGTDLQSVAKVLPDENRRVVLEMANNCFVKAREFDPMVMEYLEGSVLDRVINGELLDVTIRRAATQRPFGELGKQKDQALEDSLKGLDDAVGENLVEDKDTAKKNENTE